MGHVKTRGFDLPGKGFAYGLPYDRREFTAANGDYICDTGVKEFYILQTDQPSAGSYFRYKSYNCRDTKKLFSD